jgi:phosphoenolpyruvate carboxykinase (ATP)
MREDPVFGFLVPREAPNVPVEILTPRDTWSDSSAYDDQLRKLVALFQENFKQFEADAPAGATQAGPRIPEEIRSG